MLLVRTRLDRSHIHGIGVYALDRVEKGQRTWMLNEVIDTFISDDEYRLLPPLTRTFIATFAVYKRHIGCHLLCGDHARFLNHFDAPNLVTDGDYTVALKAIEPGEELTCNYFEFDDHASLKFVAP